MMPQDKPMEFLVNFNGKQKNDTRYLHISERCLVEAGRAAMSWPKDKLKVIEYSAFKKAVEALKSQSCDCYQIDSDHIPCTRCEALQELGVLE